MTVSSITFILLTITNYYLRCMTNMQKHIIVLIITRASLILFGFFLHYSSYSQDPHDRLVIKDLRAEYAKATDLSEKSHILYDYCLYYKTKDYQVDSVIYYANKLISLSENNNFPVAAILGHRILGSQYTSNNRFKEGKVHLYQSISLAKEIGHLEHIYDAYNPLAKNYFQENKLDSAFYYFNKCIESAPPELYSKHCMFHIGLAAIYDQLRRPEMEEKHLLMSYDNALKANIKLDQIIALTEILDHYSITKIDPVQFNLYKKSYDKLMSYYNDLGSSFHSNFLFLDSLPYDDQVAFLYSSLIDNKETGYIEGVYFNYLTLQEITLENKEYKKCLSICNEAIAFYNSQKSIRLELLVEIYKNKWKSESKLDDPSAAFETIEYYHYLKDSLLMTTNAKNVNELSLQYETAKKDALISEMEIKNINRTAQRNYAIFASLLLLTLGFFLWRRTRYKQRQIEAENKLQAEQIDNLKKEKKILSLTSMLEGQEAERTRIAQDLHDGLGGLLSSVRNHFSLIEYEVKQLDKLNVYDRTNKMIDQACTEVRRISHNLMPASLQLNGLIATVRQYCQDIDNTRKIDVQFEQTGKEDFKLNETKEIFIYRIIQEAVTNVLKHAEAENLLVQLGFYNGDLTLIIEDNGIGFGADVKQNGIGLQSIKSRVDHLNGQIDIDSQIGEGTTITINISHE